MMQMTHQVSTNKKSRESITSDFIRVIFCLNVFKFFVFNVVFLTVVSDAVQNMQDDILEEIANQNIGMDTNITKFTSIIKDGQNLNS